LAAESGGESMSAFVGVANLTEDQLRELLKNQADSPAYYCCRWPHKISEFEPKLPDILSPKGEMCPEGQMLSEHCEIRWKKQGSQFSVLVLSLNQEESVLVLNLNQEEIEFKKVGNDWKIQTRNAHIYLSTETRFPKNFNQSNLTLRQHYFMDKDTSTVQFVALTATSKS
jgi:hypothetical protein